MALHVKDFSTFRALIIALVDTYHDGHPYPMAERVGVSIGTAQMWHKGTIKTPTIPTLRLLCDAYGLDLGDVINLASKAPKAAKVARVARAIRGGSGEFQPPGVVQVLDNIRKVCLFSDIGIWIRSILAPGLLPSCSFA